MSFSFSEYLEEDTQEATVKPDYAMPRLKDGDGCTDWYSCKKP